MILRTTRSAGASDCCRTRPASDGVVLPHAGRPHDGKRRGRCLGQLREAGVTKEDKLQSLDVLVHTFGGDPTGAYRLGQTLRLLSSKLEFLVPEYAFSAGSLLCLSGDMIWLGDNAGLSPFDITLKEGTGRGFGGILS